MGSLVWNDGSALMFQISRVDTWGCDRTHDKMHSVFYQGICETTDNLLSCGRLAIDPGGSFLGESLSLYEGAVDAMYASSSGGVRAKTFVWSEHDVLIVRIEDERKVPEKSIIELSLWRPPFERFGDMKREYSISERDSRVLLVQKCSEKTFFSHYALALGVSGREANLLHAEQNRIMLEVDRGNQPFTIFLTSAASLDPEADVAEAAVDTLCQCTSRGYDEIVDSHRAWWSNFWERSFIRLTSPDGVADYLETLYNIHLYQMASCSRGNFPPKFNGMLWLTEPNGKRPWGAQYWVWNMEALYFPVFAANHLELSNPYLGLYRGILPVCEVAARQRWGAGGAFYPEVTPFNGPVTLTEDQAVEVQEFLLGKRARESISESTIESVKYDGVLDFIPPYAHWGNSVREQFTWQAHILSSGCELAMQYWWRYQFSGDKNWLREMAYPVMKATVQFYLEYFKKGEDGLYHIYPTNVHEAYWGVQDGIMDLAAVRGVIPRLIEASEILELDEDMRPVWSEFVEHLAPYPPWR